MFSDRREQPPRGILDVSCVPARAPSLRATTPPNTPERIAEKLGYIGTSASSSSSAAASWWSTKWRRGPITAAITPWMPASPASSEQQVRALCGLPSATPVPSAAVMVNLLGDLWYDGETYREPDWSKLAAVPNLKLHFYGKHHARHGRKMAHFTVLDTTDPRRAAPTPWKRGIGDRHQG